jgi:hypothetical protein
MQDERLKTPGSELEAEAGVKVVLGRLFELMCPPDCLFRVAELQALTDAVLDRRPATCVVSLEHRLDCLRRAVETLGPWAAPEHLVAHAIDLSNALN